MNALSLVQRVQRRNPSYDQSEYLDEVNAAYKETWDYILQLDDSYFTDTKIVTVTTSAAEFDFLYNSNGFLNVPVSFRAFQIDRIRVLQLGDNRWVKASPRNWNDDDFQAQQQLTPQVASTSGPYLYQLFAKFSVLFAQPLPVGTQIEVVYSFMWMPLQIVFNGTVSGFSAISDNFNRANANPIGAPWIAVGAFPLPQLLSNALSIAGLTAQSDIAIYGGVSWPADQSVQASVTNLVHNAGYLGLVLRCDPLGTTFYYVTLDASGFSGGVGGIGIPTPCNLIKFSGGVSTPLNPFGGVTPQLGDVFKAQIVGNTISVFQNGVLVGAPFTDTVSPILSGSGGLFIQTGSAIVAVTDLAWDNFVGVNPGGDGIVGAGTNFTQVVPADYASSLPGNDQDTDIGLELVFNQGANNQTFRVKSVNGDTSLTLLTAPSPAIAANTNYNLCTVPDIPDGHHNVISTIATRNFMSTPGNDSRATFWAALAEKELDSMRDSIMVRQRQEPARVRPFPQRILRYTVSPSSSR